MESGAWWAIVHEVAKRQNWECAHKHNKHGRVNSREKDLSFFHLSHDIHQKPSVQSLSHVRLFATLWTVACQTSLSITNSQNLLKLMSIQSVMPSNYFILCVPFSSHLKSFPTSGSFQMSQFFTLGGWASASASVLPMNIQILFHLGLNDYISLQSKGLSTPFSNTTVQKHQIFGTQLSLWSNFHIRTWLLEKP